MFVFNISNIEYVGNGRMLATECGVAVRVDGDMAALCPFYGVNAPAGRRRMLKLRRAAAQLDGNWYLTFRFQAF